jgi:hypothetical protein
MIRKTFTSNLKLDIKNFENQIKKKVYSSIQKSFSQIKSNVEDEAKEIILARLKDHKTYNALTSKSLLFGELGLTHEVSQAFLNDLISLISSRITLSIIKGSGDIIATFKLILLDIKEEDIFSLPSSKYLSVNAKGKSTLIEFGKWILTRGLEVVVIDHKATSEGFAVASRSDTGMIMIKRDGFFYRVNSAHAGTFDDNMITQSIIESVSDIESMMKKKLLASLNKNFR